MSDHCPITCKLHIKKVEVEKKTISFRKTRDINIQHLTDDLQKCDLTNKDDNNIDEIVTDYNNALSNIMDKHAPIITKEVCVRSRKPWYNDQIAQAKRERRTAERKWIKTKDPDDLKAVQLHRDKVTQLCSDAKKQFYQRKISDSSTDQKALFQIANELLYRKKDNSLPNSQSSEELANRFVTYFCQKIEKIVNSFGTQQTNQPSNNICDGTPFPGFQPIIEEQLKKAIMEGNSKSCHLDPIPTKLLTQVLDAVLPVLTKIVNSSLQSNFPNPLKSATVVPLLKKPTLDKEELQNCRPVSNLSYISKLIEKIAVEQLKQHMTMNSLHESCQSAYRACHSTETALLKITNDLLCAMDGHNCILLVMLDLSAAFDTVSHSVLLTRMKEVYGVTEDALSWLQSYLADRSQSVIIDGVMSAPKPLTTGLPQGSRIGPFAFPAYSSPLFRIARKHGVEMHMYADDTQLYLKFKPHNYNCAILKMEECLSEIRLWMSENLLKLNKKTEFMVIGKSNPLSKLPSDKSIMIGQERIFPTSTARNIGVVLDAHLDMATQVSSVCKASYIQLHNISRIRKYLTYEATSTLINALVTSKLDYNNSILFGLPGYVLKPLQMVQHCAARLITHTRKYDHITPVLMELHWLPVEARIHYKIAVLNQSAPKYLQEIVTPYKSPRDGLRSENNNTIKKRKRGQRWCGDRSFAFAAGHIWNSLPLDLRKCEKFDTFKKDLKTHLFKIVYKAFMK